MTYSTSHAVSDYPYDLPQLRNTLSLRGFQ
jgi:hypothetical protein